MQPKGIASSKRFPSASRSAAMQTNINPGSQSAAVAGRVGSHLQSVTVPNWNPPIGGQTTPDAQLHWAGGQGKGLTKSAAFPALGTPPVLPATMMGPAEFGLPAPSDPPAAPALGPPALELPAPPRLVDELPAAAGLPPSSRATPPQPSDRPLPIRTMLWNIRLWTDILLCFVVTGSSKARRTSRGTSTSPPLPVAGVECQRLNSRPMSA